MKNIIIIALTAITVLSACKKEEVKPNTTKEVVFDITNPSAGETFMHGATVAIGGEIRGNFEMHGYAVKITNTSNNDSIVYQNDSHTHGETITVDEEWINNVTGHSNMKIEFTVEDEHDGEKTFTHTIMFHCHPM